MPDVALKRGQLPGAHAREATPTKLGETGGERREGVRDRGFRGERECVEEHPTEKNGKDWTTGVQGDETVRREVTTAKLVVSD